MQDMPSVLCVCGDAVKNTATYKRQSIPAKLVRSLRVAVRRQPKMMVIIPHAEKRENVERRNEDCLNSSGLPLPEKVCWCQQSSSLHNG